MNYRIDADGLLERLTIWNNYLKRTMLLVACGGTALTLLGIKPSTKDIDLIVPHKDFKYLTKDAAGHRI